MNNHITRMVAQRDSHKCVECGVEEREDIVLVFHHLLPRCMGGKDRVDNLVMVCRSCHMKIEYKEHSKADRKWHREAFGDWSYEEVCDFLAEEERKYANVKWKHPAAYPGDKF